LGLDAGRPRGCARSPAELARKHQRGRGALRSLEEAPDRGTLLLPSDELSRHGLESVLTGAARASSRPRRSNSLCHYFGRRPFATGDESRNLAWLAPLAFGEAWHNNHHAFPTSARHGLSRWQLDPGGWLIGGLERTHLAWDVVRISPTRQQAKRGATAANEQPASTQPDGTILLG
jgi:hypothetical protein